MNALKETGDESKVSTLVELKRERETLLGLQTSNEEQFIEQQFIEQSSIESNNSNSSNSSNTNVNNNNNINNFNINNKIENNVTIQKKDLKLIQSPNSSNRKNQRLSLTHEKSRKAQFQLLKKFEKNKSKKENGIQNKELASDIKHQIVTPHQIKLMWEEAPKFCFVTYNPFNPDILPYLYKIFNFLHDEKLCSIIVEPLCYEKYKEDFPFLRTWDESKGSIQTLNVVDLAVCIGGDGTVLHCVKLFEESCPPVLGFGMGSIGFLTLFDVNNFVEILTRVLEKPLHISTRSRLSCTIHRYDSELVESHQVLNEVVCDRGPSPYLTCLDTFCNSKLITNVQADGLIVATPNGSSAYSMSAGGSIVHPSVPCILLTPICPHSLSFRPIILPDSATLMIKVSDTARSTAFVSFDGTNRQELRKGDSVTIKTSSWPIPLIVTSDATSVWFSDLSESFGWSKRKQQRPFSSK